LGSHGIHHHFAPLFGGTFLELFPSKSKVTLWQTTMAMEHGLVVDVFLRKRVSSMTLLLYCYFLGKPIEILEKCPVFNQLKTGVK